MIHSIPQINNALEKGFTELEDLLKPLSEAELNKGPEGKWSPGEQLLHLHKSTKALVKGLGIPRILIRWRFGRPNRMPRNYDKLVARYQEKLISAKDKPASAGFAPGKEPIKKELIEKFVREGQKLRVATEGWKEAHLDKYLLPHPLLGKVTVREMLFFTIFHTEHHLKSIKEQINHKSTSS